MAEEASERGGVQVIARAAAVLRALGDGPDGLSLGELAQRTGLARSTVQRIVGALADEQFVISAGTRAGVTLGPALVRLAAAANIDVDRIARPVLQDLSAALGETVDLSMLQGRLAVFLDQVIGSRRLVAVSSVGEAFPLHCTANGKAMLSCLPPAQRAALLPRTPRRLTPSTITDRDILLQQLAQIAGSRVAYDLEEHAQGICAAGVAFTDPLGRIFAISAPMPAERFRAAQEAVTHQLLKAQHLLVRLIPGSHSAEADGASA